MILYDYIAKAKANHLWGSLCAISNWAMYKEMQYRIYKAVLETEPERKYGYKVRVASYVCENGILRGGGGYSPSAIEPDTVKQAIREMETPITDSDKIEQLNFT